MTQIYPLELGDISPGTDFTRMEPGKRADGLPDGLHTGGTWLSPDNEVWKPLDAKPYPNAERRRETDEARCLSEMTGAPGHPDNWRVEECNGRQWLVRPFCYLWPQNRDKLIKPKLHVFLMVEQAIFEMNARGWEYSDLPQLAYDPNRHEWFLLDHSAAFKPETWQHNYYGDREQVLRWFDLMGLEHIAELRRRGHHVHHAIQLPDFNDPAQEPYNVLDAFYPAGEDRRRQHVYLYISALRPLGSWCKINGSKFLRGDLSKTPHVHTWVASAHLLDQEVLDSYELTFAYRPWP